MKKELWVETEFGVGKVVDVEIYSRLGNMKRYGIKLNENPFSYSPVYFFEDTVKIIKKCLSASPVSQRDKKNGGS